MSAFCHNEAKFVIIDRPIFSENEILQRWNGGETALEERQCEMMKTGHETTV